MTAYPNEQDIKVVSGRQYMIRRFEYSRRVRVEIDAVMSFAGMRTITVFGRWTRKNHQGGGGIVVSERRAWSTEPQFIEEVEQIS